MDRRLFLRRLLALTAGLCAAGPSRASSWGSRGPAQDAVPAGDGAVPGAQSLPRRALGSTGVDLPVLALGGFHVGLAAQRDGEPAARALIETALDEGIRFFDTAESYQGGASERLLGEVLADARDEVFLMTKTHAPKSRDVESARRHLEGSLERLRTDHLDLWQLHSVKSPEDVDRSFADESGAMAYLREAKATGLTRFIGVTGHVQPEAQLRAVHHHGEGQGFDTMQMPINPIDFHQHSFQLQALPRVVEAGIGLIAMKTSAAGALLQEGVTTIEQNLRFVLSLPVSAMVVGMETAEQVRQNAAIVRDQGPLDEAEAEALLERIASRAELSLEWYKS